MDGYALIDGQPYCTDRGAWVHAERAGWRGPNGSFVMRPDATLRKLARTYRAAVLIHTDGSVTTYTYSGGKVRLRDAVAGSEEARWLAGRLADALKA